MVPFERALVSSYRPFIVTFLPSLRVSEMLPLLFSRTFSPTPPLVSPKFPHVPLAVGGSPFRYKERRCWANCPYNIARTISFQDFLCDHKSPTSQTDRQTDGRHTIARPRFAIRIWESIPDHDPDPGRTATTLLCWRLAEVCAL